MHRGGGLMGIDQIEWVYTLYTYYTYGTPFKKICDTWALKWNLCLLVFFVCHPSRIKSREAMIEFSAPEDRL